MCGAGAQAPSGPPWTSTTAGRAASPAPGGDAIQTSIGPPAPGRLDEAHVRQSDGGPASASRAAIGFEGRVAGAVVAGRHRASAAPSPGCRRCRASRSGRLGADGDRVGRDVARRARRRSTASCTRLRVEPEDVRMRAAAVGDRRDEPLVVEPERPVAPVDHPAVEVGVDPVADRPVEVRARAATAVRSRPPARRGRPGSRRRAAPARGGRLAAIQRPSGDHAGWFAQPGREDLARLARRAASTSTAQIVVRQWRSGSGPRSAVNAIVRPSGCHAMSETPQSPLVTWRGRADLESMTKRCDHRSRWPCSSHRQSVRVMWRATGASSEPDFAAPRRSAAVGPDDEPGRVDLGGEREAPAVGRPGDLADRAMLARPSRLAGRPRVGGRRS